MHNIYVKCIFNIIINNKYMHTYSKQYLDGELEALRDWIEWI